MTNRNLVSKYQWKNVTLLILTNFKILPSFRGLQARLVGAIVRDRQAQGAKLPSFFLLAMNK